MRGHGANLRRGDELVAMGRLVELTYADADTGETVSRRPGGRAVPFLSEHLRTGDLYIVPGGRARRAKPTDEGMSRWDLINWGERAPDVTRRLLPPVRRRDDFEEIGELLAVTYDSDKSGEQTHWVHDFEEPRPVLVEHLPSGHWFIHGGRYKVTERGIVG